MEKLRRQVRIARRRLALQRLLRVLPWCLFATLVVAALLVAIDKYYPLGLVPWAWPALAVAAGVAGAALLTWLHGQSELDAAIEIDRRFGLAERVSSAYALREADRDTAMGEALVADALRAIARVDVAPAFRLSLSRAALLPLLPAAAVFLLSVFLNPTGETATATTTLSEQKLEVKKAAEVAHKKIAERLKEAREQDLKEVEALTKLEAGLKELAKGDEDRRQAMVKLNDLNKELAERREQLRGNERLQEQMQQLKNLAKGPADRLAEALKEGDLQEAARELAALQEKLKAGELDEQNLADLAQQLAAMEQKLKSAAEKQGEMAKELKRQIAEKRAAGQSQEAEQLEKKLARLEQRAPQMEKLSQLATKMGQCASCMKQGDKESAAAALAEMQAELSELAKGEAEGALLDDALDELADAKAGLSDAEAENEGNPFGGGGRQRRERRGLEPGRGHLDADGPEGEIEGGLYDTKVRQKVGRGSVNVTGQLGGPNAKGRVEQEIQAQFQAARSSGADPLADTHMPRGYREHARTYFDVLREGDKGK
ncbi:MAG TPA: hypothetical protein VHD36_10345 [Pirellulales bacterium]|nr:hypothetical protein [Pirellulales bacterium]